MVRDEEIQRERQLVAAMLAGERRAMEEFAECYVPPLYRFARARLRGDVELTQDIVQSTLAKGLEKLASWRGDAPLSAWLTACCRNEIAMHFRGAGRRPREVELDEATPPATAGRFGRRPPGPEAVTLGREEARWVHETLDGLPPRYAQALEDKYVHRRSVKEIAGRLAVSPKAAESLLGRARAAFRESYRGLARVVAVSGGPTPNGGG